MSAAQPQSLQPLPSYEAPPYLIAIDVEEGSTSAERRQPTSAPNPTSRSRSRATTLAHLKMTITDSTAARFDEMMPTSIDGLISSQIFSDRMSRINQELMECETFTDYRPFVRSIVLGSSSLVAVVFLFMISDPLYDLICFIVLPGVLLILAAITMRKPKCERVILKHLQAFNQEDGRIKLVWKLTPIGKQYYLYYKGIPLARKIVIQHIYKEGGENEEYLPAYSDGWVLGFGVMKNLMRIWRKWSYGIRTWHCQAINQQS
ncbi:hypothetical protein BCR33DRAFT_717313, partial [Rhizoclosmatium globosum]